jgi:hypothetical protein
MCPLFLLKFDKRIVLCLRIDLQVYILHTVLGLSRVQA